MKSKGELTVIFGEFPMKRLIPEELIRAFQAAYWMLRFIWAAQQL
jgi:hypothetical protein